MFNTYYNKMYNGLKNISLKIMESSSSAEADQCAKMSTMLYSNHQPYKPKYPIKHSLQQHNSNRKKLLQNKPLIDYQQILFITIQTLYSITSHSHSTVTPLRFEKALLNTSQFQTVTFLTLLLSFHQQLFFNLKSNGIKNGLNIDIFLGTCLNKRNTI